MLFPNMITLLGLCAGLTSIRFAMESKWEMAVTFIIIAAFIDGMDGRIARMLNSTSNFGAQLDSLADFANFGVAPAITLYLWTVHNIPIKGLGWAIALFFAMCCAVRLARFNVALDDSEKPKWKEKFFVGIPSPAGAGLSIVPMMIVFHLDDGKIVDFLSNPFFIAVYMIIIASLMASTVPTFAAKKIFVRKEFASSIIIIMCAVIIGMIIKPWVTLPLLGILYLCSIPASIAIFLRCNK